MKHTVKIGLIFLCLSFAFCRKNSGDEASNGQNQNLLKAPAVVQQKVAVILQNPKGAKPATVYRYSYNGMIVYLVNAECCDQYNYLYDEQGNIICAPSGGITGLGDGRCPDFVSERTNALLIWKDNR